MPRDMSPEELQAYFTDRATTSRLQAALTEFNAAVRAVRAAGYTVALGAQDEKAPKKPLNGLPGTSALYAFHDVLGVRLTRDTDVREG